MQNIEVRNSAYELWVILKNTDKALVSKIPSEFLNKINKIKSDDHNFEFDYSKKLHEQNLLPLTHGLISYVYKNYFCEEAQKINFRKHSETSSNLSQNMKVDQKVDLNKNSLDQTKEKQNLSLLKENNNIFCRFNKIYNKIKNFIFEKINNKK